MKKLTMVSILLLLSFFIISNPVAAAPRGTLRVALTTMPNALDVPVGAERQAHNAAWQLYNSLVWSDDDGQILPALAKSWTVSEDGTAYTFKLRKDVTFHNGEAFTADAVVYSWNRARQEKMQWSDRWNIAKSVEKVDDYTITVTTDGPSPLLLRTMAAHWTIIAPIYHQKVGEAGFLNHPIGTGPFMFKAWKKGDRIIYEANHNYWEKGLPKVQTLIFRPIPESATRAAAIKTGEVDIVTRLSSEEAMTLEGFSNVKVLNYAVDRVYYIAFNNLTSGLNKPTESPLVRKAMNYAVDVQAIIDALFNGYGRPATGWVTPGDWGYDKDIKPFGCDPEKARKLLAEAGYPNGFKMNFACPSGAYANFEQVCEAVQGYLLDVGIETDLNLMESGKYWDLEAKKQLPPLFGDSWSEESGEALPRLKGGLGGWDASFSAWGDPKIADYLKKIGTTINDNARAKLYVGLQRYMQENPPFIYLYQPATFEAINPKVKNYQPRAAENYFLKTTYIE
jgi:peptide/nickel transport system substrate-binding protein